MEKFFSNYSAFIAECKNKNKAPSVMELMYYVLAQDGEFRTAFHDMGREPDEILKFLQPLFGSNNLIIPAELNSIPPIISRLPYQIYTVVRDSENTEVTALGASALFVVCVEIYCKHMQAASPAWDTIYKTLAPMAQKLSERMGYTLSRERLRALTAFGFWLWLIDPQGGIRVTNPNNHNDTIRINVTTLPDGTQAIVDDTNGGVLGGAGSINKQQQQNPLKAFCTNLTEAAKKGKLHPVVGRDSELNLVWETLLRKTKNCPILIGDPGTGKTAIVEALALAAIDQNSQFYPYGLEVYVLDMASLMAGTAYRGQLESRVRALIQEVETTPGCVLFIDEIHMLIGRKDDPLNLANLLKPALSRGQFSCIGATTYEEYRKFIEQDKALTRRFNPVVVREPTAEETRILLDTASKGYGEFHKVCYPPDVLDLVVSLSAKYLTSAHFPDKALDILDSAGIKARLREGNTPTEQQSSIHSIKADLQRCMSMSGNSEDLRNTLRDMRADLDSLAAKLQSERLFHEVPVTAQDVYTAVSQKANIPLAQMVLTSTPDNALKSVELAFRQSIVGQDVVLSQIMRHLKRGAQQLLSPERPQGALLFAGSTGVGKTLTAKLMAQYLYPGKESFLKLDMSEYMEKHTVSRLIGAPPGYVGHENAGYLSDRLRRNPHSLVLVDEIDKAHQDVLNIFLQILEDGEFTDGQGNTVNCRQSFFIFTTNAGSHKARTTKSLGFCGVAEETEADPYTELSGDFKPEFLNRMDGIMFFNQLSVDDLKRIFRIELSKLEKRLAERKKSLNVSDGFTDKILSEITANANTGAREMRRLVEGKITDIVAEKLTKHPNAETVSLTVKDI